MTHTNKTIDLKCLRALDGILLGTLFLIPIILLHGLLITIPLHLVKYIYIIPIVIIYRATFKIPKKIHGQNEWKMVLKRLRFFSTGVLALSPFWGWWGSATGNIYLLINVAFLILFSMLYIYNFVTLVVISAQEHKWSAFAIFAKLTRLTIIYIMIAPLFAFLLTIWYIKNSFWSIILFFLQFQNYIVPFIIIPLLMVWFILMQWRRKIELHLHKD